MFPLRWNSQALGHRSSLPRQDRGLTEARDHGLHVLEHRLATLAEAVELLGVQHRRERIPPEPLGERLDIERAYRIDRRAPEAL
jgi:hypothetical protein